MRYTRQDMSSPQQCRPQRHEIGDCVLSIADEFVEDAGDEAEGFATVESYAACEATLCEEAGLGDYELIYLQGRIC